MPTLLYFAGAPPVLTLNNRIFCKFEEIANLIELKVHSRAERMLNFHARFVGIIGSGEPRKFNGRMLFVTLHRDVGNVDGSLNTRMPSLTTWHLVFFL